MIEKRDGLTFQQQQVIRELIMPFIRRKCICGQLSKGQTCYRCHVIRRVKDAFPQNWEHAADIAAQIGPLG